MTTEPLIAHTIAPANNFLWAVKTYLDLISGDRLLTYGSGLKRLFVFSSGITTFNDEAIEAITAKAERLKIVRGDLRGFMNQSISKNLSMYGQELHRIIAERVVKISNGDVRNPDSFTTGNMDEARRYFYTPPLTFLVQLQKALNDDIGLKDWNFNFVSPIVHTLSDTANNAVLLLSRMQAEEGYSTPIETSWSSLMNLVEEMAETLKTEAERSNLEATYKTRSIHLVKILWVIAKLLMGDLTLKPHRRDTNLVDLTQKLNLSDGTLAALPFPIKETVKIFEDTDHHGLSMKGRMYLSAVSAAIFYRQCTNDD